MKNRVRATFGVLVLLAGLFPAAVALADDRNDSNVHVQATTGLHVDAGERDSEYEGDHASTSVREESDRSDNDNHQGDEDTNEIDVDHESMNEASSTADIEDADKVGTMGDLRSFLNHVLKEDDHIDGVHVSSTTIETRYDTDAKLFGAIPMNLTATVTVNNDGTVSVTYPWYAFLFAKRDDLEGKVNQAVSSSTQATASATLSASTTAHLLNAIFSALKQ